MVNLPTIRGREQRTAWILLLPALLMLLFVFAYPIGRAFWLSFFTARRSLLVLSSVLFLDLVFNS